MTQTEGQAEIPPDLFNCDREPIRVPGSIQPHGLLLVLDPSDLTILQASENLAVLLGVSDEDKSKLSLSSLLGDSFLEEFGPRLRQAPAQARPESLGIHSISVLGEIRYFQLIAHRNDENILLELERDSGAPTPDIHPLIDHLTQRSESASNISELSRITAQEVRQFTQFDRVLIYRFDENWNGTVVGEDGNGRLPQLLDHRFPASDIPAQARELYRLNRVRIIPDANYTPVPISSYGKEPGDAPLDMTYSTLRSVSPIHLEYMRNMETVSSMSISILRGGKLWGLISCHHRSPRHLSYPDRMTCELIARMFSLRLLDLDRSEDFERRIQVRSTYATLLSAMANRGDFAVALAENQESFLAFANAQGAAIVSEEGCQMLGTTPGEKDIRALAKWLFEEIRTDWYHSDSLSREFPPALGYTAQASGLLAIAVSKVRPNYIMWFRPEVMQIIKWGGDPHKSTEQLPSQTRIHPRKSFETWREIVRNKAIPWLPSELEAARELRNSIVGTVLKKAEELADLNTELTRSNRELEAFSYSVSHDLRAPLRHIVGYAEILKDSASNKLTAKELRCIETIIESSEYAGRLVDKLLGFSRLGRADLQRTQIDMNVLLRETISDVMREAEGRAIQWKVGELPAVYADLMMLRMAVRDLLSNAVKYSRHRDDAAIEVSCLRTTSEYQFSVKDNGVGFDMAYADKLFGVFQRLHKWEDYEGTGIGLANVRRVVERHQGRTWAMGQEGVGATFFFTLPVPDSEPEGI